MGAEVAGLSQTLIPESHSHCEARGTCCLDGTGEQTSFVQNIGRNVDDKGHS